MTAQDQDKEQQEPGNKKFIIIVTAVGAGVLLLGALIWYAFFSGQFATYTDNTYHITIKYPRGWTVAPKYAGTVVTFVSPKEDGLDTFQENLNVAVMDLSQKPMRLDEYTQLALKQMSTVFKNIKVTESKPITFAGQPAYKYVVSAPQPDDLILSFIWFIKDNQAYTITYAGQGIRYEKYRGQFDEMVRSFSIPTL
jgi:hypothetical protein